MKILYDYQIFNLQKIGGISRYFYELYSRSNDIILPIYYTENYYLKNIKKTSFINNKKIQKFLKKINRWLSIKSLFFDKYDIFHPTYYNKYFFKYLKAPFVITVHDMIHEIYEETYFQNDRETTKIKRILCEKADGIIAISENTKKDLIKFFGINESKIKVIYHGSSLKKENKNITLPKKYILFTGARWEYKNFNLFIVSVQKLLKEDKELNLICMGAKFTPEEEKLFDKLEIKNKVYQILAKEDEVYTIYKNAECFVFPSLYEGFGIPILEAFESECPIVLSNTSCFPEIAGEAGEYFDPLDKNSMEKAIKNVLYNKERQKELIEKGKERLKNFSWEKTYKETIEFYKEIIEKNKN